MIDLHSHLLPFTDDGARDLAMSLKMARLAVEDGVSVMAATPHFQDGLYAYSGDEIRKRIADLQGELDKAAIPLRVISGGDNRLEPNFVLKLKERRALTLNDTDYVLVEPPHDIFPVYLESCFFDLLGAGYRPILTHPERMAWFQHRFDKLERLFKSGVHLQLTAGSILGRFGRNAVSASIRLLDRGMVSIVASDAHNDTDRRPGLSDAFNWVQNRYGDAVASRIFIDNPALILKNEHFVPGDAGLGKTVSRHLPKSEFLSKIKSLVLG